MLSKLNSELIRRLTHALQTRKKNEDFFHTFHFSFAYLICII